MTSSTLINWSPCCWPVHHKVNGPLLYTTTFSTLTVVKVLCRSALSSVHSPTAEPIGNNARFIVFLKVTSTKRTGGAATCAASYLHVTSKQKKKPEQSFNTSSRSASHAGGETFSTALLTSRMFRSRASYSPNRLNQITQTLAGTHVPLNCYWTSCAHKQTGTGCFLWLLEPFKGLRRCYNNTLLHRQARCLNLCEQ